MFIYLSSCSVFPFCPFFTHSYCLPVGIVFYILLHFLPLLLLLLLLMWHHYRHSSS